MVIRLLPEQDDRESFDCRNDDLNDSLHFLDYAEDVASGKWRVWVAVADEASTEILAFYVSSPDPVRIVEEGAESIGYRFRAIDLRLLATDYRHQRRGYGTAMVMHAYRKAVEAADQCLREAAETAEAVDRVSMASNPRPTIRRPSTTS